MKEIAAGNSSDPPRLRGGGTAAGEAVAAVGEVVAELAFKNLSKLKSFHTRGGLLAALPCRPFFAFQTIHRMV